MVRRNMKKGGCTGALSAARRLNKATAPARQPRLRPKYVARSVFSGISHPISFADASGQSVNGMAVVAIRNQPTTSTLSDWFSIIYCRHVIQCKPLVLM
jgi:hypothetical protein